MESKERTPSPETPVQTKAEPRAPQYAKKFYLATVIGGSYAGALLIVMLMFQTDEKYGTGQTAIATTIAFIAGGIVGYAIATRALDEERATADQTRTRKDKEPLIHTSTGTSLDQDYKAWTIVIGGTIISVIVFAALLTAGIIWEKKAQPEPAISEAQEIGPYTVPEPPELLKHALLGHHSPTPKFIVRIPKEDEDRLIRNIIANAPKLGWYAYQGDYRNDVLATIPQEDLHEVEELVKDPVGWITRLQQQLPETEPHASDLMNVVIDTVDYRNQGWGSLALIIASSVMLGISIFSIPIGITLRDVETKQQRRGEKVVETTAAQTPH